MSNVRALSSMPYLFALLIASSVFATVCATVNLLFCYVGVYLECSGSRFLLWLIPAFIGLFVCLMSTGIQLMAQKAKRYKTWHTAIIFTGVSVLAPKAYMFFTSSVFIFDPTFDFTNGLAGFSAGLVMLGLKHGRSNPSFKRDALKRAP